MGDNLTNLINDSWWGMEKLIFPYGVTQEQQANGLAQTRTGDALLW